jgi:quinol monooxygenase YgiN
MLLGMVRNVVVVELKPEADREAVAEIQAGLAALDPPGCTSYTIGDDLGLRDGGWSFAIVADFADAEAYVAYDAEAAHNRLRAQLAEHVARMARVQFRF